VIHAKFKSCAPLRNPRWVTGTGRRLDESMNKNILDGGEAIVEAFRNLGIDYVFSSPGSEWGPVWEAFARQKVEQIPGLPI